jgi:hypothetical protein
VNKALLDTDTYSEVLKSVNPIIAQRREIGVTSVIARLNELTPITLLFMLRLACGLCNATAVEEFRRFPQI